MILVYRSALLGIPMVKDRISAMQPIAYINLEDRQAATPNDVCASHNEYGYRLTPWLGFTTIARYRAYGLFSPYE
jgi:hypothetical protein